MELSDLDHEERLALVALVGTVIGGDGAVSEDEQAQIARIAEAFGDEHYQTVAEEADERFSDEDALKDFLETIQRQDARELIYGTVLSAALPDVVDPHESSLLGWLATAWGITVQFEA